MRLEVVLAVLRLVAALGMEVRDRDDLASGLSPPLCERQDCNCTEEEGLVHGRRLRVNCEFAERQVIQINSSSLPSSLYHLSVIGGSEVRLLPTAFSRLRLLERVSFSRIRRLVLRHNSFHNASGTENARPGLLLEIEDCDGVLLESGSLSSLHAPLTALVARTGHVVVQGSAFSWLRAISIVDVQRLDLHEFAFALDKESAQRGGPLATVVLQNTILSDIPRHAFPSPLADVLVVGSEIRGIRRDAFSALQMRAVALLQTSVHRVDGGAFSPRTLLSSLEVRESRLHQVSSGAVCSAVNNLTIFNSKMWEVLGGAFNLTVATVSLSHNVMERVRSRGFVLRKWSSMDIHNNTFNWLEPYAFSAPYHAFPGVRFRFTNNIIGDALPGALGFAAISTQDDDDDDELDSLEPSDSIPPEVNGNQFQRPCHCHLSAYLGDLITIHPGIPVDREPWITGDLFFNTSSCMVDSALARCFRLSEGFLSMSNFTEEVCVSNVECEEKSQNDMVDPRLVPPGVFHLDTEQMFEPDRDREKLVMVALIATAAIFALLVLAGITWIARKGNCGRSSVLCSRLRSMASRSEGSAAGGLVSASSARSISRLSVNEYVRQHGTGTGVTTLTLHDSGDDLDESDAWIPCEDKATQTLPEELTQELLQSLREKLDDPENYSEARDMIEHLYDLIKVEESCNNNEGSLSTLKLDDLDTDIELEHTRPGENVYDIIGPKTKPRGLHNNSKGKSTATVGTRAPSPDKLAPLGEYADPRNRTSHVYTELPGQNRPGFGVTTANRGPTLLCDYSEPTDARIHVYCELPGGPKEPPTVPCSPNPPSRMANRPLPTKPDQRIPM